MKINWGTKLVFFALLFMTFVVYMVVRIMQTDVPMVEENYYEKGLNYQKEIDNHEASKNMVQFNVMNDDSGNQHLIVINVSEIDIPEGKLIFYRPSDPGKDIVAQVALPAKKHFDFPMKDLAKGKWTLKFVWTANGSPFEIEQSIDQ